MISVLWLLQAATPLAPANTPRPAHDAVSYEVRITVPDTGKVIHGMVTTAWHLLSADPIRLELDTALSVDRVTLDGRAITGWRRDGELIFIPHGRQAGARALTAISYHGAPWDGLVIKDSAGARTIFADNWPNRAHRWFPSQDYPSDKAAADFYVTAPDAYQVIANGDLVGHPRDRGHTVWHYRMEHPIPVYTMVIGAAKMARTPMGRGGCAVRCIPLEVWTYPEDSAYAVTGPFRRVKEIVDYFTDVVGEFPFSRLTHIQTSTIFGGMENSTAIFYDEGAYRSRRMSESTVAHETAHQWFGDAVTEHDWPHLWLSEGFATYFAALWAGHVGGDSALHATMNGAGRGVFRSKSTGNPIVDSAANLLDLLNTNNYQKGSWVLHSLRGLIGDSAFFAGIRKYYSDFRDSTALSEDFQREMETTSGADLGWYFTQALHQPGYPKLEIVSRYDTTAKALQLTIRQTQPEAWGLYRLPGFELLVDDLLVRVDIDGRESHFSFDQFAEPPRVIVADPNGWWLSETKVTSDR
ncbi:MAG TPA: M1 family aminopeptidase [Gemmatimonadales bacterium]|jgi:aminopeptidase N|nr:M1 family aminopeptidase [Gemmatimonadales bacterium]